jgi:hypothetical protein
MKAISFNQKWALTKELLKMFANKLIFPRRKIIKYQLHAKRAGLRAGTSGKARGKEKLILAIWDIFRKLLEKLHHQ